MAKTRIIKIANTKKIITCILYKNQLLKLSISAKTTRFTNLKESINTEHSTAITEYKQFSTNARTQISKFQENKYQNSNYMCNGQN